MTGLGKGHCLYESFIMYFLLDYFAWDNVDLPPYKEGRCIYISGSAFECKAGNKFHFDPVVHCKGKWPTHANGNSFTKQTRS